MTTSRNDRHTSHQLVTAAEARRQAARILSKPPYTQSTRSPRPLAGVFHAIGHAVASALGPAWRWIERHVFVPAAHPFRVAFGSWWPIPVAVLATCLGIGGAALVIRRRVRHGEPIDLPSIAPTPGVEDPATLDRAAADAEATGAFADAVRLRFRAGLARLELKGLVHNRAVKTRSSLSGELRSPTFDRLAGTHEAIAYGGRTATPTDADDSRAGWPVVEPEVRQHAVAGRRGGAP